MRTPVWFGNVVKGRIKLDNASRFTAYLATLESKRVELVLREKTNKVSPAARGYYNKVVIGQIVEDTGNDPEQMKEFFKKELGVESTADMSPVEFQGYVRRVIEYAESKLGIKIPDPERVDWGGG